jgi:hypothetical protein
MDSDENLEIVVVSNTDRKFTVYDFVNGQYERITVLYDFTYNFIGTEDMDGDGDIDFISTKIDNVQNVLKFVWLEYDSTNNIVEHIIDPDFPSSSILFTDYDEDGKGDIIYSIGTMLYLRTGSSMFIDVISTSWWYTASNIRLIADLNNDGLMDIVGSENDNSFLLKGISYFGFEPVEFNENLYECQLADLNGDNLPELITRNNSQFSIQVNTDNFEFETWDNPVELDSPISDSYVSDFDLDGDMDIITSNYNELLWIEMDGLNFIESHTLLEDNPIALFYAIIDCDLDGDLDVIGADYNYYLLYQIPIEDFTSEAAIPMHKGFWQAENIIVTELDNDTGIDLLFKDEMDHTLHFISNISADASDFEYETYNANLDWSSNSLVADDWNGDGNMDILTTIGYDTIIYITGFANGEATFEIILDAPTSANYIQGVADFDNNGSKDILYCNSEATRIAWNNNGVFTFELLYGAYHQCEIIDFDNDGWLDIAFTEYETDDSFKTILWNDGGVFEQTTEVGIGIPSVKMPAEDVNMDGLMDIVYVHNAGSHLTFDLNLGDRTFQPSAIVNDEEIMEAAYAIRFADMNGDGRSDAIVHAGSWLLFNLMEDFTYELADTIDWYLNYIPNMYNNIFTTNINGDQFDDLIVVSWHSSIFWCNINNGDFPSAVTESIPSISHINIYPNPCASPCTLDFHEPMSKIEVFDMQGKLLMMDAGLFQITNLNFLESGVYIISCTSIDGEVMKSKLIVE